MSTNFWRRVRQVSLGVLAAAILAPATAQAQIVRIGSSSEWNQAFGFNLGYFVVKSDNDRGEDDVLFRNKDSLIFDTKDFNGATIGAEWLIGLGEYLEGGVGVSYYQKTVPSIYGSLVQDDGTEIEQDLKLRIVPITATVRFLPIGRRNPIQPYVGAGIGFYNWRYSEAGEFVDFNNDVFRATFEADGNEVGPVVLGGIRFAASEQWLVGGEFKWQDAKGDTGGIDAGFLGDEIHLGGWSTSFTLHFKF